MIPGDKLHKLIKSLTPPEKRYFKLSAAKQGDAADKYYLQLFDAIDKLHEYDEELLKKKLKGSIHSKNLAYQKHYLFEMIMQALKNFEKSKSPLLQVLDLLREEEIFKDRGLVDLQERNILKAKQVCYEQEQYFILLWVLKVERVFYLELSGKDPEGVLNRVFKEEKEAIEILEKDIQVVRLSNTLHVQYLINPLFNDKDGFEKLKKIEEELDNIPYESLKTFTAKSNWYLAQTLRYRFYNKLAEDRHYQRERLKVYEEYKHIVPITEYIKAVTNYLGSCHRSGDYKEFNDFFIKLNSISPENAKQKEMLFSTIGLYKLLYALNMNQLEKMDAITAEIETGIAENKRLMKANRIIAMYYSLSLLCFLNEKFNGCLDYCSRILDMKSDVRFDLQNGVWLIQIICHYELGNTILLESLLRSANRFLHKNNIHEEFDRILISGIRNLMNAPVNERGDMLKNLLETIDTLRIQNLNYKFVIMEETLMWLNARVKNIPIAEESRQQTLLRESKNN
ncbi:MAG: hypothetical protein WAT52_01055 [Chitinophagales bacterium]|nr:hypothetical protein [Bacteroidota bacterium]